MARHSDCRSRIAALALAFSLLAGASRPAAAQRVVRGIDSQPTASEQAPQNEPTGPAVVRGIDARPAIDPATPENRGQSASGLAAAGANSGFARRASATGWLPGGPARRPGVQPASYRPSTTVHKQALLRSPGVSAEYAPGPRSTNGHLNWIARAPERAESTAPAPEPAPDPRFGGNLADHPLPPQVADEVWPSEVGSDDAGYPDGFDDGTCDELPCRADDRDTLCGICCGNSVVCQYLFARKNWDNLQVFGGVTGFKGQPDAGRNGNFGFHQGFNLGAPLLDEFGIGRQTGIRVVETDISGGGGSTANRVQIFYTSGFFHRALVEGWQYGVVSDYLRDDFGGTMTVAQLRLEWSYLTCCGHEAGAWITTRLASDTADRFGLSEQRVRWEPADAYLAFYRWNGCDGRTTRLWAGATGQGEAVIGSDSWIRLSPRWAVQGAFGYRIPKRAAEDGGASQESWALTMNVVCLPFGLPCFGGAKNPYRPLFNVADNSTFFINQF